MSAPEAPKPRLWPRLARGPLGNTAMFQCMGDIPHGWEMEEPLPGHPVPVELDELRAAIEPPRRGPGRPRKAK